MSRNVRTVTVRFPLEHITGLTDPTQKRQVILDHLTAVADDVDQHHPDLIVFCESVQSHAQTVDQAESLHTPGPLLESYQSLAARRRCTVAGSLRLEEDGNVHNTLIYFGPDGSLLGRYHKTYLTTGEIGKGLTPGQGAVVVDTPAGRLGGVICFDLNFDDLCQQYQTLAPDILTFASNYHGGLMQQLWAYRTQAYFAAALPFIGGGILDPHGQPVTLSNNYTKHYAVADLNLDRVMIHLDHNRHKFPDIRRKYGRDVLLDIPPFIGTALLYSQTDRFTAMDLVREFDLELRDDYFDRSITLNATRRPVAADA